VEEKTESSLVEALRGGDPAAFDQVYEQYRARLFSFLIRLARRRDVAEDLLEETWVRLVSHASRLEAGTRLGPWLFTVARNLYWSYCRSRMVEDQHAGQLIGLWPAGLRSRSPLEEAVGSELERRVERALGDLPTHYREALMLVAFEELTPGEAASVCGVSPVALRQRLSRARAMLAAALAAPEPRGTRPKEGARR
jgi:RNA polymerase sigma-70 factor (ECF subfamily)